MADGKQVMNNAENTINNTTVPAQESEQTLGNSNDPIFVAEQKYLTELYAVLERLNTEITEDLNSSHHGAAQDLIAMSQEVALNFSGYDEALETYAAIETLNSVIDAYNLYYDANVDKLRRLTLLLAQPYFAKVTLIMRPGQPPRDVYIGAAGITDEHSRPLIVDWRSPVAETYYNQEMGQTSYQVNGRTRTVELTLRRQFDITRDTLNGYFDTTVAIEDSLLLAALRQHHSEKLRNITATIQREQNVIVRHEDVPVLLVNGIAGSGKTSVLLQRIAFLLYRMRDTLAPTQVWLFSPNSVFERYIDTVLPSMGEANPHIYTWNAFMEAQGASGRDLGLSTSLKTLQDLEAAMATLELDFDDVRDIRMGDEILIKVTQIRKIVEKVSEFCARAQCGIGSRFTTLVKDELYDRLDRRFNQLAKDEELQEMISSMDIDDQIATFGQTVDVDDEKNVEELARQLIEMKYGSARELIENLSWLRLDRIGMRILGTTSLNATEWLYLKLLFCGEGDQTARYVMIDEVQDYTQAQLTVLAKFFAHAHFMLLGDEHQAIYEHTASFDEIRTIFTKSHKSVDECRLLTSYRSSPEITALFTSLLDTQEQLTLSSVQRAGVKPVVQEFDNTDTYLEALRAAVAAPGEGLTAIVAESSARVSWLAKQLIAKDTKDDETEQAAAHIQVVDKDTILPAEGLVLLPLSIAKGLEFDHVIIPDAQAEVYPDTPLSRRRLYTAISRAMHRITIFSQGSLTPLLANCAEDN